MIIAQLSDTHVLSHSSDHPSTGQREHWLRQCVADINRENPDAVIFTGDTVQHGQADEYAILREALASLEAPLYVVPGNRDAAVNMRMAFSDKSYVATAGEFFQYVIDEYPLRLVALDSTLPGERKGVFCDKRQAWLDAVLSEQPDRPTCLFIHHPPFDVDDHYVGGYRRLEDATAFAKVVSRHAQVQALFCGHVHWPVERQWAGAEARIMPSVAVDLRKGIDETRANGRPVYMLHTWLPDNILASAVRFAGDHN